MMIPGTLLPIHIRAINLASDVSVIPTFIRKKVMCALALQTHH
jgi:hypothetical protein